MRSVDRHAVRYLDFYIDIMNTTFNQETIGDELDASGQPKPIKFPMCR